MITFILCLAALLLGYCFYSRYMEKLAGVDHSRHSGPSMTDGSITSMPWWRVFLIQFLNIAGLGPIFGPSRARCEDR